MQLWNVYDTKPPYTRLARVKAADRKEAYRKAEKKCGPVALNVVSQKHESAVAKLPTLRVSKS